jgi:uncharacterized protein (DUF736 family)
MREQEREEEEPSPRPSQHPNAPDYILKVYDGNRGVRVGAAWLKENGSVSIKLNSCVVLDARDFAPGELLLTLWPNDDYGPTGER